MTEIISFRISANLAIVLSIWIFGSFHATSQRNRITFQHLNIENGLLDNSINCVSQDDAGFIWLG